MIALQTAKADRRKSEMVDLFSIDDVTYQVPARPRVNVALQFLTDTREHGESLAQMMLLEKLLGPEGYAALAGYDALSAEDLTAVSEAAAKLTLGALETPGNGEGGSLKSVG